MLLKNTFQQALGAGFLYSVTVSAQCHVDNTVQVNLYSDNNCANFVASTCYPLAENLCLATNLFTSEQVLGMVVVDSPGNTVMDFYGDLGCSNQLRNKDGKFLCPAGPGVTSHCCGLSQPMIAIRGFVNG